MPPSTGPSDVTLFLLGGTPFPVTPGAPLSAAEVAALEHDAVDVGSATVVGDGAPYVGPLAKALDTPVPPVLVGS